ncbi:MAG TPA: carbohydrate ABC transporter permease [Tissierellaceae bacterium]
MISKRRMQQGLLQILLHIILILGAVIMTLPFIWTLSSSFKDLEQIFKVPPTFIPRPIVFSNYPRSLQALPFGRAYFNSIYIASVVVLCQLLTASMAAYGFGRLTFPGSKILFILFLATMMIPGQVTMIPLFLMMRDLKLTGTHWSLILPAALFNAFGVFLLRQFVMGLPSDLEEAAVVDGASVVKIYFTIILPLLRPALAAFGIFVFLGQWNSFLYPLIFLNRPETFTVPLLLNYFKGIYITEWPLLMAGTVIAVLPVLIVYIIFQRQIIEGIAITGIKS